MRKTLTLALLSAASLAATPAYDQYNLGGWITQFGQWHRDSGIVQIASDGSRAHAYLDPYNWMLGRDRTPSNETLIWASERQTRFDEIVYGPGKPPELISVVPLKPPKHTLPPPKPNNPHKPDDCEPPSEVPEPSTYAMLVLSAVAFAWKRAAR